MRNSPRAPARSRLVDDGVAVGRPRNGSGQRGSRHRSVARRATGPRCRLRPGSEHDAVGVDQNTCPFDWVTCREAGTGPAHDAVQDRAAADCWAGRIRRRRWKTIPADDRPGELVTTRVWIGLGSSLAHSPPPGRWPASAMSRAGDERGCPAARCSALAVALPAVAAVRPCTARHSTWPSTDAMRRHHVPLRGYLRQNR